MSLLNVGGKYLIEQVNVEEGEKAEPPYEMAEDELTPFTPPSSEFANNTPTFELTSEQQKLEDKVNSNSNLNSKIVATVVIRNNSRSKIVIAAKVIARPLLFWLAPKLPKLAYIWLTRKFIFGFL